jgi:3-oxoacyl-(acyl-carrier-protein) synthase
VDRRGDPSHISPTGIGFPILYIRDAGLERRVDAALSNSFGFGGINACLVFRRAG